MIQDEIMKLQTYKMFEGEDTVYVERDDVLEVLKQQPCEDAISRQAVLDCLTATGLKKFDFILDARDKIKNLPPVTPKGVTVTDFADKCRECGREKVLDKIIAEIAIPTNSSTIKDYDEGWEDAIKRDLQIIDKYKAESEV